MRVLILLEVDITRSFDYGSGFRNNAGNNLFYTALAAAFVPRGGIVMTRAEVVRRVADDADWVKRRFDVVVAAEACILCRYYADRMRELGGFYRRLGVPVYVFGVGVHAPLDAEPGFIREFGADASRFLDGVLSSGGQIALRGEFSRAACAELGFPDLFVSGCMALYLLGESAPDFSVRCPPEEFVPAFNAARADDIPDRLYAEFPKAVYFDQDVYGPLLRTPFRLPEKWARGRRLIGLYRKSLSGRPSIRLHQDLPAWLSSFDESEVSFSYGSRMHGNLLALLAHRPCYVRVPDMRVRELVEFYRMPSSVSVPFDERKDSLYHLYRSLDWSGFLMNYRQIKCRIDGFLDTIAPRDPGAKDLPFPPFPVVESVGMEFRHSTLLRLQMARLGDALFGRRRGGT